MNARLLPLILPLLTLDTWPAPATTAALGQGATHRFHDLALDAAGNIYVADLITKRICRFH